MNEITDYLDNYLQSKNLIEINAVDANAILAKAGILKDSKDRPGKPLRDLLRKGKLPHAYQNGNRWLIPVSKGNLRLSPKKMVSSPSVNPIKVIKTIRQPSGEFKIAILLKDEEFKRAQSIDSIVPDKPGIYCIKIINPSSLPKLFHENLLGRKHDILYIGIATKSLKRRFLHQELRAIGHGTFFRSLGAMLGYKPLLGSLIGKANTRNYKFSKNDSEKIIEWINCNLKVNWLVTENNFELYERELIEKHFPLLNLAKNPKALSELSQLRSECVRIANSLI